ncbi:MAG: pseudouridine synthase [Phormidesmis priestleyi]|uniref:Pseudouridine synthase n=1 Tax=Phormidesmis priestleyi TaxID=268141 RepID=A0A2W4XJE2_9CYAN|nr:MAG: pseudouridine synthase [Phormidesmis priestleyi]
MTERLQKLLSQRGIASRRQAEKLILSGRVTVNGKAAEIGQQADTAVDRICVNGVELGQPPRCTYLLLHKPKAVVSTCKDPQGRKTVLDLLDAPMRTGLGIHPVGRLDANSTGALLLTNDGELTYQLTHPRHQISKLYQVCVRGLPTEAALQRWRTGVMLAEHKTLPAQVDVVKRLPDHQTLLRVRLVEGRNRQIRLVADLLGYPVTALHRIKIGSLRLGNVPLGRYRLLTETEVVQLKREAASPKAASFAKA